MPTPAAFLDGVRASRLLEPRQVDDLAARPEAGHADADGLAAFARSGGWLTPFQIDQILAGLGHRLRFGPICLVEPIEDGVPGPHFRVFHQALGKIVAMRPLAGRDPDADLSRACSALGVRHRHLAAVADAGEAEGVRFVASDCVEGTDLARLVAAMGPLPTTLACTYVRQAAEALAAVHARGLVHGAVSPRTVWLAPVARRLANGQTGGVTYRPQPGAAAVLTDLGLLPDGPATVADDVRGLGETLTYLLTGRPLDGTPLRTLRPDVPGPVDALAARLLSDAPPPDAAWVARELAPFGEPSGANPAPAAVAVAEEVLPDVEEMHPEDVGYGHAGIDIDADEGSAPRVRKPRPKANPMWLIGGVMLHVVAAVLLVGWALGWYNASEPKPDPAAKADQVEKKDKKRK